MASDELTHAELLAENARLRLQLEKLAFEPQAPHAPPTPSPHTSTDQTTVHVTPEQATIKTVLGQPTGAVAPTVAQVRARAAVVAPRRGKRLPEEILGDIANVKTVITSGVEAAGYGDKRTDFRSLTELRQILADLEEELEEELGTGGRIRQIRMTTQWDKGL
jgi:hypothetical protein